MAPLVFEGGMPIGGASSSVPQPSGSVPEADSHSTGTDTAQPQSPPHPESAVSPGTQESHTNNWANSDTAQETPGYITFAELVAAMGSSNQNSTTNSHIPTHVSNATLHTNSIGNLPSSLANTMEPTTQDLDPQQIPEGPVPAASSLALPQLSTELTTSSPPTPPVPSSTAVFNASFDSPFVDLSPGSPVNGGVTNNPAATTLFYLGPANADLKQFLMDWSRLGMQRRRGQNVVATPEIFGITSVLSSTMKEVKYEDLNGDELDLQGINWASMGVTRREARTFREKVYKNYCANNSDAWKPLNWQVMPQNTETYFRFKQYETRKAGYLVHFQLRNLLAAPSRSRVFYADRKGVVRHYDAVTGKTDTAFRFPSTSRTLITAIAAGEGLVVAGGLEGEYCTSRIKPIYGGGEGFDMHSLCGLTHLRSGISNHIQVYSQRSGGRPVAALASNDSHLRLLDLTRQTVVSDVAFVFPINCTAVSPDRKMRVVVGDDKLAYIVAAEHERSSLLPDGASTKPDILQTLGGHKDYGFACAWADDGYTLATGHQDRAIKIWDARKTCNASGIWTPIATLRTSMASARSLHFTPAGSGKRLLMAAEEADVISIIDAQTFQKRQAFDLFGELAGVGFTDNGQDLFALCTDSDRGGILHLQRDGIMSNAVGFDESPYPTRPGFCRYDWPEPGDQNARLHSRATRRRLRTAATLNLQPF